MDLVKTIIIKALPEASTDLVTSVLANMEDHGVNSIDHLKYFKPETDCTVLKTIQRRVLQKEIESYFAENSKLILCNATKVLQILSKDHKK